MSDDPSWQSRSAVGLEPAIGEAILAATQRLVAQTARSARTRVDVEQLMAWHGNQSREQLAGFLFELMSADAFNRQAILLGEVPRAFVTASLGSPHAAADIRIVGASGAARDVQAKIYENAVRAAARLAKPSYRGLDRLVPHDQYPCIDVFYEDRITRALNPLRVPEYVDAQKHLTDRLRMDGVESVPISYGDVQRAAKDPRGWANRAHAMDVGRQIGAATLTGAAIGAVLSVTVDVVRYVGPVRAGEMPVPDAARALAGSALIGASRNGAVAGLGASIQLAATRGGVAASVFGKVPAGAVASAVVGVAESALAFVRGGIGVSEFALRACETTFVSGASWAGGALGHAVIPFPVVGALAGGLAAQWCATIVTEATRSALCGAVEEDVDPERKPEAIAGLSAVADRNPAEVLVGEVVWEDPEADPDLQVDDLETAAAMWPFGDADEFQAWLADPDALLLLDPNVRASASTC